MSSISPSIHARVEDGDESSRSRKRLRTNSTTSDSKNGDDGKPITRRKTACQTCRLRKVKCDGARPACGLCKSTQSSCEYIDPLPQKLTLDSATKLLCGKLDKIQQMLGNVQQLPNTRCQSSNGYGLPEEIDSPAVHTLAPNDLHRHDPAISAVNDEQEAHSREERAKDFLRIPAHRTTADTVLAWEVFEHRWPRMALIGVHFQPTDRGGIALDGSLEQPQYSNSLLLPEEEAIPFLVDRFLENVHTKNPVLDVEQLVRQSRRIAASGLKWDGWSCLVLLASALGAIARPFSAWMAYPTSPVSEPGSAWTPSMPATPEEIHRAESYFVLACRRLGCFRYSMLAAQCHFFAGVYLMYTLRPLLSWQYFIQASHLYQLHMKTKYGLASDLAGHDILPLLLEDSVERKIERRLEESMYWSCFKSESEFRVELPLPQSDLSSYAHPSLFPSPPSPAGERTREDDTLSRICSNGSSAHVAIELGRSSSHTEEAQDLRKHAKLLCNEEESWYYYLTEIALRRIGNRIINAFFGDNSIHWSDAQELLSIAVEFDTQVSAWSANLPVAMQNWEMSEAIRAPVYNPGLEGASNPVSRELSWAIDNRLLEMRSWLYQPFVHFLVHLVPAPQAAQNVHQNLGDSSVFSGAPNQEEFVKMVVGLETDWTKENAALLHHFITSGIECCLKILDVRSLRHRHHGLWFDLRATVCASLILLAVVKSGHTGWIPGGPTVLWGAGSENGPIEGKIGHVLIELAFWANESPDMGRHREVLEAVTRAVRAAIAERSTDA